jgi:hypothetical protein
MRGASSAVRSMDGATGDRGAALGTRRVLADSFCFGGSGASSVVHGLSRRVLVAVACALLGVVSGLFASSAWALKYYDSTLGGQSASAAGVPPSPAGSAYGGSFSSSSPGASDIAVNNPAVATDGASRAGWVYVVDRANNRVQAFDQNRVFQWAIGRDVIASTINEHQNLKVTATGGQFRLEFNGQTTGDLAFGVPASGGSGATASVQNALRALTSINGANVNVTGGPGSASGSTPYVISFVGTLAAANQPAVTVQPATAALAGTATVSTIVDGTNAVPGDLGVALEKCTAAFHCKAGVVGSLGGEFNGVQGIDIDQTTGDFFVWERNTNARIQQFDEDGGFIRAFGWDVVASGIGDTGGFETCNATTGAVCKAGVTATNFGTANPGQFGSTTANQAKGIATAPPGAPNAGQLYVADPGSCRIQRFTIPDTTSDTVNAGTPFGLPSEAGAAVEDDRVCTTSGLPPVPSPGFPRDIAVDANGVVYASASNSAGGSAMVKRFDTTAPGPGAFLSTISVVGADNHLGDGGGLTTGLEVDPASDHLLIARSAALGIVELDLTDKPATVDPSYVVDRHLLGLGADPLALGVGGGRYFMSTSTNVAGTGSGQRILVLDDDGVEPDPVVTINPATGVGSSTATFGGHVDPVITTIFQTSYRWQVSKDGVSWTDVTNDALVGGNGFTPQTVSASVTGLEPNTLYRVRIRTTRSPAAGLAFSSEMIFHTDPEPPTTQTRPAQHVSDVSAQLIGNLNPGGLTTSYWFEWGDNNYGNITPAPAGTATGGLDRLVGETISGLVPERVYHYRLCAQNSMTATKICGTDVTFTTNAAAAAPAGRSYEIVTAPDKASRRGAHLTRPGLDFSRIETGLPSMGGDRFAASYFAQPADADAGYGYTINEQEYEVRSRSSDRWSGQAVVNIAPSRGMAIAAAGPVTWSGDLGTSTWGLGTGSGVLTAEEGSEHGSLFVKVLGDDGGPRGGGWYQWLDSNWATALGAGLWVTRMDDGGERLIAQSMAPAVPSLFRDVIPADGGLSPDGLTPSQTAGRAVFMGYPEHDWRPADLVNECTGSGGSATLVLSRDDGGTKSGPAGSWSLSGFIVNAGSTTVGAISGSTINVRVGHYVFGSGIPAGARVVSVDSESQFTISVPATAQTIGLTGGQDTAALANDTISARPCEQGSPTDARGANFEVQGRLGGSNAMTMSDDGDRVFFVSPDPSVAEGRDVCEAGDLAVGGGTACPAQLFVRQFDDAGNATVRWLSRPEDAMLEDESGDPQMSPVALGTGVAFEGASRDGSVVYFRTDAPLTEDDPNGGLDPLVEASPNSWDLYRYDLGTDNNADPASGDPGDRLTRITAGPTGTADPNTNCTVIATAGPQDDNCWGTPNSAASNTEPNGEGAVVRFLSDDGERAYIVTAAAIPGADNNPPEGGLTTPTSADDQVNVSTRNLYVYDATKSGASAYEFIARIPFTLLSRLDACASFSASTLGPQGDVIGGGAAISSGGGGQGCVHGSGAGDGIVFSTTGQLASDDVDAAGDVYVYDASTDALTRLSAPSPGDQAYVCGRTDKGEVTARCNGDLGFAPPPHPRGGPGLAGQRHWNVAQDGQGRLTDVFFETRLSLVSGDGNIAENDVFGGMDVYRWRRADGRLSLVSPGMTDGDSAFYTGSSLDGRDVFFWTEQRISPWEIDESDPDIYNATTRDPLPGPPPPPIVCDVLAYACQGGGTGSVAVDAKTPSTSSDGNAVSERRSLSVAGLTAKARRRAARSGVLALRVRSTGAGKVTAVAKGRIGKRTRQVARSSVQATGVGTMQLRLRLSSAARSVLSRGRSLRLAVDVSSPGVRSRSMTVLLERSR